MCVALNESTPGATATLLVEWSPQSTETVCVSVASGSANVPCTVASVPATTLSPVRATFEGGVLRALTVSADVAVPTPPSLSVTVVVTV